MTYAPRRRLFAALLLISFATTALALTAARASAFIYWADAENGWIGRAANDGTGVEPNFIRTGALPVAVAVDSAHVYWANQNGNSIGRADIDGANANNGFVTGVTNPSGVAVNGSKVFWGTLAGTIGRANLDGSNKQPSLVSGLAEPCGLALDSGHVYWAEIESGTPAYIARAGFDGSNLQLHYVTIPGTSFPCGVAVNSTNIFWTEPGFFGGGTRIGRANTNTGEGADPNLIGGGSAPCGAALDATHLYWANSEGRTIGRANTDATAVNQSFIATGGGNICGVAVDSLSLPPVAPQPEHVLADINPPQTKIAKGPGSKLSKGKATFRFRSTESGSSFACKLDKRKVKPCHSPKSYAGLKSGKHVFRVWATDAAGNKDPTPAKRAFRVPARPN
jgi:streptogramin lyase